MDRYMIVPVFNEIVLPEADFTLHTEPQTKEEKNRMAADGNKVVLLPLTRPVQKDEIEAADFQQLGVTALITGTGMTESGRVIHARSRRKVQIQDITKNGTIWEASVEELFEGQDPEKEKELLADLKRMAEEALAPAHSKTPGLQNIRRSESVNEFALQAEPYLKLTPEEKYGLLRAGTVEERGEMLESALQKLNHSAGNKASSRTNKSMEERDYEKKIARSGMPDEVREEVDRVLNRYKQSQINDPERSSLENYLDFVTSLKWKPDETPDVDLSKAREILNRDHYGLDKVKERILQQIAVMTLRKDQAGSILLLVGAPGTGKTSMGRSIAEALGRKYARISLGGVRDEAEIRGHRRTYVGAMPGRIMEGIKRSGAMNPVIVLDEIDKLAYGYEGNPASALLEVLDPEQNSTFTDHYMNVPYDLSHVFFICTANTTQTIPGPLLDRMEVINLSGYTPSEKLQIARRYLLPKSIQEAGLKKDQIEVSDDALNKIIEEYTMEAGVRGLKKQLDILSRHTAADIVEHGDEKVTIGEADIPKYLGTKHITHDKILDQDMVGVVTGLAWTQVGGEILFIETRMMHGHGQIILTGQLGDVMKESARISVSLVKSLFIDDELDFDDKDIHIHVPSGAVPKDGPSAGVTLFTALTSLVTGIPVSRKLAMTGEISLRGQVMPIGGLPEKLMAADRAGITKVLIPADNVQDLEDVPQETRDHLQIIPVKTIHDVLREALGIEVKPQKKQVTVSSFVKTEDAPQD